MHSQSLRTRYFTQHCQADPSQFIYLVSLQNHNGSPNKKRQFFFGWMRFIHTMRTQRRLLLNILCQDNQYLIKWVSHILKHKQKCQNQQCLSHKPINMTDFNLIKQLTNSVVLCTIQEVIRLEDFKPMKSRRSMENMYLQLISYLSFESSSPLQGYIHLKQYERRTANISIFFKFISIELIKKLQFKQNQVQNLQYVAQVKENYLEKLDIPQILRSEHLIQILMPKIVKVVQQKIRFWTQAIQGFTRIEEYHKQVIVLSKLIWDVKSTTFKNIKVDPIHIEKSLTELNGIELKILSIIFSVVLNDYYGAKDIETKLDEILAFERNLQQDIILNYSLLNDEAIIMTLSIIANRGEIVNINRQSLANFLHCSREDDARAIKEIQQIIPQFIAVKHNNWINAYIKRGQSKLFSIGQQVFYKDCNNFIHSASLRLLNLFNNPNDYQICGSILKTKQNYGFILFDVYGRLLGMSVDVFFQLTDQEISIEALVGRAFIFHWFRKLLETFNEDCNEINGEGNDHITSLRTATICPIDNLQALILDFIKHCQNHQLFEQYGDLQFQKSKVTSTRNESMRIFQATRKETLDRSQDTVQKVKIMGFEIPLLDPVVKKSIDEFFEQDKRLNRPRSFQESPNNKSINKQDPVVIKYTMQFQVQGSEDDQVGYFICQIYEMKQSKMNHGAKKTDQTLLTESFNLSVPDKPELEDLDIQSDNLLNLQFNDTIINKLAPNDNRLNEIVLDQINQSSRIQASNYKRGFTHQLLDANSKEQEITDRQFKDLPSQLVSPRNRDENQEILEIEEFDIEEQNLNKDSSQKNHNKRDVLAIIVQNKKLNNQTLEIAAQSTSSATSDKTQNSVFNLIKVLQYQDSLPQCLMKIYMLNSAIMVAFLAFIVIKVILVEDNLSRLQKQMILVESPNKFNQMYCHFMTYSQMEFLKQFGIVTYNDYENQRLIQMSALTRSMLTPIVAKSKNDFANYQQNNELLPVKIQRINGLSVAFLYKTFFYFVFYFNQESFQQNKLIQQNDFNYTERQLVSHYTLKLNIQSEMQLTQNLLDAVYTTFFSNLDENKTLYIILLLIEILVLACFIPFQIPLWKQNLMYQQRILLLISRASQKDAEGAIQRYQDIEKFLTKWKTTNFHSLTFLKDYTHQTRKAVDHHDVSLKLESRGSLGSRIQESRFTFTWIYLLTLAYAFFIQMTLVGLYVYTNELQLSTRPQLELSMSFIKFKYNFDQLNLLGLIIKTEPLFEKAVQQTLVFEKVQGLESALKEMENIIVKRFNKIESTLYADYENIYDQIQQSKKISQSNKQLLVSLYSEDLCGQMADKLPFCSYENGKFEYFANYSGAGQRDDYSKYLKLGMTGVVQALSKTISSSFGKELETGEFDTDLESARQILPSQQFTSLFMSYYLDLYQPFLLFESSISGAALEILTNDSSNNTLLHALICGIILFASQLILLRLIMKASREVQATRQALVNLPFSMLLDSQTVNQIKRLDRD